MSKSGFKDIITDITSIDIWVPLSDILNNSKVEESFKDLFIQVVETHQLDIKNTQVDRDCNIRDEPSGKIVHRSTGVESFVNSVFSLTKSIRRVLSKVALCPIDKTECTRLDSLLKVLYNQALAGDISASRLIMENLDKGQKETGGNVNVFMGIGSIPSARKIKSMTLEEKQEAYKNTLGEI